MFRNVFLTIGDDHIVALVVFEKAFRIMKKLSFEEAFQKPQSPWVDKTRPKVLDVKRTKFEDGIDRFIKKAQLDVWLAGGCERYFVAELSGSCFFLLCVYYINILFYIHVYNYIFETIYIRIYYDYDWI